MHFGEEGRYSSPCELKGECGVNQLVKGRNLVCKKQVWVLNNLLIHISEICFWFISVYSLLLFPTYLGVGMDSQPRGTCQGCDNNSLNPKKGMIAPAIASGS